MSTKRFIELSVDYETGVWHVDEITRDGFVYRGSYDERPTMTELRDRFGRTVEINPGIGVG